MAMKRAFLIFFVLQNSWNVLTTVTPKVKMYYVERREMSWNDAYAHCQKLGMHLVSIRSKYESSLLLEYIKKKYGEDISNYWLGAFKENDVWKWKSYNEVIDQEIFWLGQGSPDNNGNNEFCVHTYGDFLWNDIDCSNVFPFICELQLDDPTYRPVQSTTRRPVHTTPHPPDGWYKATEYVQPPG